MRTTALALSLLLAGHAGTAVPVDPPSEAERARWTMGDMKTLATAIEAYAVDNEHYPTAASLDALIPMIEPTYIRKAPARDAWGRPFIFVPSTDGKRYTLASAGSDGVVEQGSWAQPGELADFAQDAVLDTGRLLRHWQYR